MLIIVFIVSALYSVAALQFSGDVDRRIRGSLLAALKKFHLEQPAFQIPQAELKQKSKNIFEATDTFSNDQSGTTPPENFEHDASYDAAKLSPYLVTDDHLINCMVAAVIKAHFTNLDSIHSDASKDCLQLLILKYYFAKFNNEVFPKNIRFYIIMFISEIIYGVDSKVPNNSLQCKIDFIRQLRMNPYSFPKSLAFAMSLDTSSDQHSEFYNYKRFLPVICSKSSLRNPVIIDNNLVDIYHEVFPSNYEFNIALCEEIFDQMPLHRCSTYGMHSKIIFNHLTSDEDSSKLYNIYTHDLLKFYRCEKQLRLTGCLSEECYFYSRNTLREFEPRHYTSIEFIGVDIHNLIQSARSSIYEFEMFSMIIRLKLIDSSYIYDSHVRIRGFMDSHFHEILVKESETPLKMSTPNLRTRLGAF
jgi:uncharacterized protein YqfB (UPF0267 family)